MAKDLPELRLGEHASMSTKIVKHFIDQSIRGGFRCACGWKGTHSRLAKHIRDATAAEEAMQR